MVIDSAAEDICSSNYFSGVSGSYLRPSILAAGLDPDNLPSREVGSLRMSDTGAKAKAWKDIWSAGQGVGTIHDVPDVAKLVHRMRDEFALAQDCGAPRPDDASWRMRAIQMGRVQMGRVRGSYRKRDGSREAAI
jgi:NAD(P)H-dependent flavin oxidoreductase YrpB (nitropropane dioxygenase family)